jgi:parvulin-like peptidyl-prolyl isomerase
MNYLKYFVIIFVIAVVGCPFQQQVLLTIGSDEYTVADFKLNYQFAPTDDSLARLEKINDFVDRMLMVTEARGRGYDEDPVVRVAFETHRRELLSRTYYEDKILNKIKIPDAEVKKVYDQIIDQYHIAQIVVDQESLANYIDQQLQKGIVFDSLLKYTLDTLTEQGDIGTFSAISLPPEILEPLKETKVGGTTGVIPFGNYYYIFKVLEHKKADSPTYGEVKENIRNNLLQQRVQEEAGIFVENLIEKARIEYNPEGL